MAASVRRARERSRRLVVRALRRLQDPLRIDIVNRSMFSPIPSVPPAGSAAWNQPTRLAFELDVESQLAWIESTLAPYLPEFESEGPSPPSDSFPLDNGWYQAGDAELLYAIVRHLKPRQILELGAGYSTLVTARACAANVREGHPVEFTSVDPEPRRSLSGAVERTVHIERRRAAELEPERFTALTSGDVLFVDTTHTVKRGSEVNWLILEVLPTLHPGVVVHFHDIFLPYDYPQPWFARGTYLSEQYLLHAFLACNVEWEVLLAAHAIARAEPQRLTRAIPSLGSPRAQLAITPAAFWLRRLEVEAAPARA